MSDAKAHIVIDPIFSNRSIDVDESLCFVLMPYIDELQTIYTDVIRPVVHKLDMTCLRADEISDVKEIIEDIWTEICRARLIIADVTTSNPNVYYELGIAHTLGKEVICISQNEATSARIPFDISHRRLIKYDNSSAGIKKLKSALRNTILVVQARPASRIALASAGSGSPAASELNPEMLLTELTVARSVDLKVLTDHAQDLTTRGDVLRAATILADAILRLHDKPAISELISRLIELGEASSYWLEVILKRGTELILKRDTELMQKQQIETLDSAGPDRSQLLRVVRALISLDRRKSTLSFLSAMLMTTDDPEYIRELQSLDEIAKAEWEKIAFYSTSKQNRISAALWLYSHGMQDSAIQALKSIVLSDETGFASVIIKGKAVDALMSFDEIALPVLHEILRNSLDADICLKVAPAVGRGDLDLAVNSVKRIADREDSIAIRVEAAELLSKLGRVDDSDQLLERLLRTTDFTASRLEAKEFIGRIANLLAEHRQKKLLLELLTVPIDGSLFLSVLHDLPSLFDYQELVQLVGSRLEIWVSSGEPHDIIWKGLEVLVRYGQQSRLVIENLRHSDDRWVQLVAAVELAMLGDDATARPILSKLRVISNDLYIEDIPLSLEAMLACPLAEALVRVVEPALAQEVIALLLKTFRFAAGKNVDEVPHHQRNDFTELVRKLMRLDKEAAKRILGSYNSNPIGDTLIKVILLEHLP